MTLLPVKTALSNKAFGDVFEIVVFYTNDRHGSMAKDFATFMNPDTPPPLGGLATEAALVKKYREWAKETGNAFLYLDQGDIWQGAPVGSLTDGEAPVIAYNALMPDAITIGNHEYDSGHENVSKLIKLAKFPFLGVQCLY